MSTRAGLGYNRNMRTKRTPRIRVKPASRHKRITFVGDEGKLWRGIAIGAGAFVLLILLVLSSRPEPQLMSSAEIQNVKDRGVLRVGVRADVPGFSSDGEGLETAFGNLLAQRMLPEISGEAAVKLVTVTSATVGARLDDGTIDVAFALMEKGGSAKYLYSDAYYVDSARLITPEGKQNKPLINVTIGCLQATPWLSSGSTDKLSSAGGKLLDTYITNHPVDGVEKKTFASYDDMLTALQNGTIGAAVMTDLYIREYRESYAFSVSSIEFGSVSYAMICTTDSPAYTELFNLILSEMNSEGSLAALYARYGLDGQGS